MFIRLTTWSQNMSLTFAEFLPVWIAWINVDGVWIGLCFKTETGSNFVDCAIFARDVWEIISGVEVHSRRVCGSFQVNSSSCVGDLRDFSYDFWITVYDEVVIISNFTITFEHAWHLRIFALLKTLESIF